MTKLKNLPASKASSQVAVPTMGRPPSKQVYIEWANKTMELAAAIKMGAGDLSNAQIEKELGIGVVDKKTSKHTGRYFSRYLNGSANKPVALKPDRLAEIAERARTLGWLKSPEKSSMIQRTVPLQELSTYDGRLLSEHLTQIQRDRLNLLNARQNAIDALHKLSQVISSCRRAELMYPETDVVEGKEVNVYFGVTGVVSSATARLAAAIVIADDLSETGRLSQFVPKSQVSRNGPEGKLKKIK